MLADVHTLQALRGVWTQIAKSEDNFNGIFEGLRVPGGLVAKWRAQLCPNGKTDVVAFEEAFVHGATKAPAFIVELNSLEEFERTLGDSRLGSVDKIATFLRSQVTITAWAKTKSVTQAMSVIAVAIMRYAQGYLRDFGYMGQGLVRGTDLNAWEDLGVDGSGHFRRRVTWRFEQEWRLPPLQGDEAITRIIAVHHEDAVDSEGNPGRVSPRSVL
jgi:hypothetical protein